MPKEVSSLGDLQRSYSGTHLIYKGDLYYSNVNVKGARETPIIELSKVEDDGTLQQVVTHEIDLNKRQFKDVQLGAPDLGWYMHRGGVPLYLARTIRRQYKFGIHGGNMYYYRIGAVGKNAEAMGNFTNIDNAVRRLMLPKYGAKYKKALEVQFLSRRYMITNGFVYQDIYCIGKQEADGFRLDEDYDDSLTMFDLRELGVPLI